MWTGARASVRGLAHLWRRSYLYVWANLFWAVLTLLVITAPAAWAALTRLSYIAHREPLVTLDDFWQGFRETWRMGILLAIINVLAIVVTVTNLFSYSAETGLGFVILRIVWIGSLLLWLVLQYFAWVFYFAMKQPHFPRALRNAGVMLLTNPLFTLGVLATLFLVMALCTILPAAWILIGGAAMACIANSAVQDRLRAVGLEAEPTFDEGEIVDPSFSDV
jgi:uncharacterized membrane protein YesL